MIISSDIEFCRKKMETIIGKRVVLKTNGGRKRILTYVGVVDSCHPNIFTVKCECKVGTPTLVSFSYVDLLTKTVRLALIAEPKEEQAAG